MIFNHGISSSDSKNWYSTVVLHWSFINWNLPVNDWWHTVLTEGFLNLHLQIQGLSRPWKWRFFKVFQGCGSSLVLPYRYTCQCMGHVPSSHCLGHHTLLYCLEYNTKHSFNLSLPTELGYWLYSKTSIIQTRGGTK